MVFSHLKDSAIVLVYYIFFSAINNEKNSILAVLRRATAFCGVGQQRQETNFGSGQR